MGGQQLNVSAEQAELSPMEYVSRVLRAENASRPLGQHIAQIDSMGGPTRVQCQSGFKLFPGHTIQPQAAWQQSLPQRVLSTGDRMCLRCICR